MLAILEESTLRMSLVELSSDDWLTHSVTVGDVSRRYHVVPPSNCKARGPLPVVLVFHGGGSNARDMARFTRLAITAEKYGHALIFFEGTGPNPEYLTWNAGSCCGHAVRRNSNDVGYVERVLDELPQLFAVDESRIYATGFSNGGMMCYRTAEHFSDRLAAFAPVSGIRVCDAVESKVLSVPLLHIHGTSDRMVPLTGGIGDHSVRGLPYPPVEEAYNVWLDRNRCEQPPMIRELLDTSDKEPLHNDQGMGVTETHWRPAPGGAETILVTIKQGGHTWPGIPPQMPFFGRTPLAWNANEYLFDFFKRHRRE